MAGMSEGYVTSLVVVTNEAAGGTVEAATEAALEVLRSGADVRHETCREPGDLDRVLDSAGDRTVVVAGGDGSVHAAVQRLASRDELSPDRPLGLVPLGTGNDLARTLGLPLDPADAARVVLRGRPRPLDLLVDETGAVVVNAVHLGVGAEAAAKGEPLKDRLGMAAYAVGSVVAGATATGWSLRIVVDGAEMPLDGQVLMVAIANGRTIGGGTVLAPDAEPDDGVANVVVSTSTGPLARLGFAVALRDGEPAGRDDVMVASGRKVTVAGDPVLANADGELFGPITSRTWTVRPAGWSVLAEDGSHPASDGRDDRL